MIRAPKLSGGDAAGRRPGRLWRRQPGGDAWRQRTVARLDRDLFTGNVWTYSQNNPTYTCVNEDANRSGFLDAGEHFNGNGRLDPGLPVVVSPATVTTDSDGFATFKPQYGENMVPWIAGVITARAQVGGTESSHSVAYTLEAVSTDFTNANNPPAGVVSPFGVQDCASPN